MSSKLCIAILAIAATPIGIVACATTETDRYAYDEQAEEEMVCRRERVVGSHFPVRVCRSKKQVEEDREGVLRTVGPLRPMGGDELKKQP